MIEYMTIMRELANASARENKEIECIALAQVAWLCLHRIYEISNNDDVQKAKEIVSDLNMRRFMKGGDK